MSGGSFYPADAFIRARVSATGSALFVASVAVCPPRIVDDNR
jgi:hypothetical protein